ncbi:MAG: hypothetical protein DCF15_15515 [Phormidesmis priestleyi]|uniref:Endonuclease NucS C-terminal domain-containing protein n=1 Tax=Phormidesmis priestleyi TaxID=268141 RepID=A0A2W4X0M0_9CYAN|nr:MAG: hypothetical protein DCF15_15515 [Phormidesmis priestleyi]
MAFIQAGQNWQFSTESDLEEVIWRNLPKLLNLRPLSRQFSISGKFCDILAIDESNQLVVIELKNTEDRYVVQQLVRYYNVIKAAETLPFKAAISEPRLLAIAPSFHADTLIDCQYSTLKVELITFALKTSKNGQLSLVLSDVAGSKLSALRLPKAPPATQPDISLPEAPRKLLNWLSHSSDAEYDWVMQMRKQLLSFDTRMKEIVTSTSIFYGRGKTKACCELRKERPIGGGNQAIAYFLWLPHPEYRPHVIRMMVNFNLQQQQIRHLLYCRHSYRISESWSFPSRPNIMGVMRGMPRFQEHYEPLLNAKRSIKSADIVELALRTWYKRL